MLSRTAENLFWLTRYVERADNVARLIEVASRLANLPSAYAGSTNEWTSALIAAGCQPGFEKEGKEPTEANVVDYLAFSPNNPSSIRSCFEAARTNARAVRTALTIELWEAINGAWLELQKFEKKRASSGPDLARFLAWTKEIALKIDGTAYRTLLRDDGYSFTRLGVYVERADNTARILDVKYHVLLPHAEPVGGGLDYFQWAAILRSVSAQTSFHHVYKQSVKPWLVADFLVLNPKMPRSLVTCYSNVVRFLDSLADLYDRSGPAQEAAHALYDRLLGADMHTVFNSGLHEFITDFVDANIEVSGAIAKQYLR
jgi:uncharacterized alpha-E superfamily protein